MSTTVILQPWGSDDLPLLERLMGDPRMTEHLGGPEGLDKLRERQGLADVIEAAGLTIRDSEPPATTSAY